MQIASTTNPRTQSVDDVPVVVLAHSGQRIFVGRPDTYDDLVNTAHAVFDFPPNALLQLSIATLDVCRGEKITIHGSAYAGLRLLLDVVDVDILDAAGDVLPLVPVVPVVRAAIPVAGLVRDVATPERDEARRPRQVRSPTYQEDEEQQEEGEERAGGVQEPDSDADMGVDEAPDENAPDHAGHASDDDDSGGSADSARRWEHVPSAVKAEPDLLSPSPFASQAAGSSSITAITSTTTTTMHSSAVHTSGPSQTPRRGPASSSPADASGGVPERYTVAISHPPSDARALFKTRAGHLVGKVLGGACRAFAIDYARARLYLVVVDDEGTRHMAECDKDDTMARAGVGADAELVIEVDEAW